MYMYYVVTSHSVKYTLPTIIKAFFYAVHLYSLYMEISLYIVHMHDMYKFNEGEFYYTYTLSEYLHNSNNYCVLSLVLQLTIMIGV